VALPGAEKRAQRRRWQDEVTSGGDWYSRGAWTAAGQREPGTWSWPRAILQVALTVALVVLARLLIDMTWAAIVGVFIGYCLIIARAHALHRRYVRGV
jgi:hypothetical protein